MTPAFPETVRADDAPRAAVEPVQATTPERRYRRILLPFVDSPASWRALDEAVALARDCGATLELISVFEPAQHVSGFEPARVALDDILPRARARVAAALSQASARAREAGVEVEQRVVEGAECELPRHVADLVARSGADLVVIGTHGRRGVERALLGSVAEAILRLSPVPVLMLRVPQA